MTRIEITSFQWGMANDLNRWQAWAFWNSKNIEYRKNSQFIELAKGITNVFDMPSGSGTPVAVTFWRNSWSILWDVLVITNTGKIVTSAGVQHTLTNGSAVNIASANGKRYIIGAAKLNEFVSYTSVTENIADFWGSQTIRPVLNFFGDLIIGDGNKILRYNEDASVALYTAWATNGTIWGLEWTVYAITQVWVNVYVWCNDGTNTNLYIWDGSSANPSQIVKYSDRPIRNVALLGNMHYWWDKKSDYSLRHVSIGESYQPQDYVKSDFPKYPLSSNTDDNNNRMAIHDDSAIFTNAIETLWDIVFLPWYGSIYSFGRYFPWDKFSFNRDYTFDGSVVYCMASGWKSESWRDLWGMLAFTYQAWSDIKVWLINIWQDGETPWIFYSTSGWIESMEFVAPSVVEWEQNKKILVPIQLEDGTSIKVWVKRDKWSYELVKTLTSTDYSWYTLAEIPYQGQWSYIQFKFELIWNTWDQNITPKLFAGITNISVPWGNKS